MFFTVIFLKCETSLNVAAFVDRGSVCGPPQVAVKNNIDVFYFSVLIPLNIFFVEDGKMGKIIVDG